MARQLGLPVSGSLWPPYSLVTCAQLFLERMLCLAKIPKA
jgi:hypothetical protein